MRTKVRLTETIPGEPQLGLQQLSQASLSSAYRNSQASLSSAYRTLTGEPENSAYRNNTCEFQFGLQKLRRASARLTETIHRRASTRLTAAITGEPQLGLQKLRYRGKNAEKPLKAGYATGSCAPRLLRCPHLRQSPHVKVFSDLVCIRDLNDPSGGGRRSWRRLHFDT